MKIYISLYFIIAICFNGFSQNDAEFYLNKAQKALDEEKYQEAIKNISKVIDDKKSHQNNNEKANLYLSRSICKFKLKNYDSAEEDLNESLKISPEFLKAFDQKNRIYFSIRRFDKIIKNSNKALELNPNNTNFLLWLSQSYVEMQEYDSALVFTDSILHINDDDISALRIKGLIYHRQKKYEESIKIQNRILNQKPNDSGALLARGVSYAAIKQYDKAENDNNFVAKTDSSLRHVAYNNTAFFIKIDSKDYAGAIVLFNKCLELEPSFAYAYSNKGFCKLQLGDIEGANKDIAKSIELDPNNSFAYKNYALVKIKENKISQACNLLKKANEKGYSKEYDEEVNELLKTHCK